MCLRSFETVFATALASLVAESSLQQGRPVLCGPCPAHPSLGVSKPCWGQGWVPGIKGRHFIPGATSFHHCASSVITHFISHTHDEWIKSFAYN